MSEDLENYIHILDEEYETPEEITVSAIDTVDGVTILPYRLPKINFDMYQKTITDFAVYPEKNTGGVAALSYCGLGLGGETGEVLEHLKKIQRDNDGEVSSERREALSKELGDVLWYLCRLASELGLEMNTVALENIEKLQSRLERNVIQGDGDNR